ncbi:Bacterial domain of uncharacterised function (DUF1798) [Staphylococcus microti]|uniref:Bacterial domain of uncharacterized function (DUF1798) n=2 Tax=Staphylococcus microti TaxID=569857 RepID=A0A380GVX5_9STAP|nr:Bacterial domain of uncharacterised function (DUF1798) [Staphylococcus microti]
MILMAENVCQSLLLDVSEIESRYHAARAGHVFDFHTDIVPFVAQIDQQLDDMQQMTDAFSTQRTRIVTLLQTLSVSCHDKRTSKKQFYDQLKTVKHDIMTMMQ